MRDALEDLIAEFIERRDVEPELDAEAFVGAHPGQARALRAALVELAATEQMFPNAPLERPSRVGEWIVSGELGRGGAGRVLRVRHEGEPAGVQRALKLLAPGTLYDPRALVRLEREGALLGELDHPGIVSVHEVGESAEGPWIVMDLIEGPSLAARLIDARQRGATGPLTSLGQGPDADGGDPWRVLARFGAELGDALAAAHARGLLHRDVKPSNVLLEEDGRPVLIDFGLAAADGDRTLTRTGDLIGTPHYMAPEQARGERVDARADVWGLGAVLYELASLRPPVESKDPLAAIESLRRRRPRRLSASPEVPRSLARIIDRALSFRPGRRFDDMATMARHLRQYADGAELPLSGSSFTERIEDAARIRPMLLPWIGVAVLTIVLGILAIRGAGPEPVVDQDPMSMLQQDLTMAWVERDRGALRAVASAFERENEPGFAALARALAGDEPLPTTSENELVRTVSLAEQARRDDAFDDAMAGFESATALAPQWSLPTVAIGRTAREAGNLDRAISEWRAAVRLVPEAASLRRRLGKILRETGDLDSAIESFRAAARLAKSDWRNHGELARALAASEDPAFHEEALEAVRTSQRLAPEPSRLLQNIEAALLDGMGRHTEARQIHLSILDATPNHAATWHNVGLTYIADCMIDEAKAAFERSIELDNERHGPHMWLAWLASGDVFGFPESCGHVAPDLERLYAPRTVLHHLRAALLYGPTEFGVLYEANQIVERTGQREDLADLLEELAADRPIDETTVLWTRTIAELRRDD